MQVALGERLGSKEARQLTRGRATTTARMVS